MASSNGSVTGVDGTATLTYTVWVTNTGTSPAYSVLITDMIPAGISATSQLGGDSRGGPVVGLAPMTWAVNAISNVASTNVVYLTYTAQITQPLSNQALTNTVIASYWSLTDTTPSARPYGPITATRTITTANVSISKTSSPPQLRVGDVVTYRVALTVPAGTVGLGGSSLLSDTLPQGVEYITDSETLEWIPLAVPVASTGRTVNNGGSQQVITWTFGTPITSEQAAPTVVTLTLQAQVTGMRIDNGSSVFLPSSGLYTATNSAALWQRGLLAGSGSASNQIIQPSLAIAKSSAPAPGSYVGAGDRITYTLLITDSGYGPAYDTVISDALPAGLTYLSSSISSTTPVTIAFDVAPAAGATGVIVWQVNQLFGKAWIAGSASGVATMTVVAQVTDTIGANLTLTNTAAIPYYDSEPGPGVTTTLGTIQRTYADGSSSVALRTVNAGISKAVTFTPPPTATLGAIVTYTLFVPAQPVTDTLNGVMVTDTLPASLGILGVEVAGGTGGSAGASGQVVTATFATIPVGTQGYVTVTALLASALGASAGNTSPTRPR